MKKKILVLILLSLGTKSYAQFEVIDKIAGVLIPGISKGINEVIAAKNKDKGEEADKLKKEFDGQVKELQAAVTKDISNLTALNDLFALTGALYDNIAAMKLLTDKRLLDNIAATGSQGLMKETAILFALNWRQVEAKKDKLASYTATASSGSIQDDISGYVSTFDNQLNFLSTTIGLEKNPSGTMDAPTAKSYIENLNRAETYISEIEKVIASINVQLNSRLKSYNKSLSNLK